MKAFRSTLILLVVLAGLVAYIFLVERKKTPGAEEAKPKVFAVAADQIAEVQVKTASDQTAVKKDGSSWQIVQPIQAPADESEVSSLTSALSTATVERVVDERPGDLKQYGLAEPRVEVTFKTSDGKQHRLLVGDKTPTGADLYVKLPGETKVFLVPASFESSFNRSTFDLRDKRVLNFDRNKVDLVAIATASGDVRMAKKGEQWAIADPIQAAADYGTVEGLIGRLQTTQMTSIVEPKPGDLAKYGLAKPEVTVSLGAGSAQSVLQVGTKAADGGLYARDASRPLIFTIEAALADELKKPANDYRRKDVFEARPYNATRLEITRGTEALVFEKVKGEGKDATEKWRQTSPSARDVDQAKIDDLLTKLTNLRVQAWAAPSDKTGIDKPVLTVSVAFDEGKKQERVAFARPGTDVYAARTGESGAARIDTTEFDAAVKALDALK